MNTPSMYWMYLCIVACFSSRITLAAGGIATDGTMGVKQTLSGTTITIPQTMGTTSGGNLFHSFTQFNIDGGQTVVFTENVTNTLNNIISSVTGGYSSTIDGTLRSTPGGHANFYLINPQGVTFGPGAQLDVPAAFHVSTADEISFADGHIFSATHPATSTLTSASPAAFGFFGATATNNSLLDVNGSQWTMNSGKGMDLVARNITIENNAALTAESGTAQIIAVGAGNSHIPIVQGNTDTIPPTHGTLNIDTSVIDTSGNGAGRIVVRSGNMTVTNSILSADNNGASNAMPSQGITLQTDDGTLTLDNGLITAHANSRGNGGTIAVTSSRDLSLINGSSISSSTYGIGNSGNITVKSGAGLTIDDNGSGSKTGIHTTSAGDATGAGGNAGTVSVTATGNIVIENGGMIFSATWSNGKAGSVTVKSGGTLTIDDGDTGLGTGIYTQSNTDNSGDAGMVAVSSGKDLTLSNGGTIGSATYSINPSGSVTILSGGSLTIDTNNSGLGTGIYSIAEGNRSGEGGNAGAISVTSTSTLLIRNGGEIGSVTYSTGKSGDVTVTSGNTLTIDGQGFTGWTTGIGSESDGNITGIGGNAGAVSVTSQGNLSITNGGEIYSNTVSTGNAGNLTVMSHAGLLIDGKGSVLPTGIESLADSGNVSSAGTVSIRSTDKPIIQNGGIINGNATYILSNTGITTTLPDGTLNIAGQGAAGGTKGLFSETKSRHDDSELVSVSTIGDMDATNGGENSPADNEHRKHKQHEEE